MFRVRGSRSRFVLLLLTPVLLATFFPWRYGLGWLEQVPPVIISAIIPLLIIGTTVPESFAGEREKHTLETLLASRLPDRAILFGKAAVSMVLAFILAMVVLLIAAFVVNLTHWQGHVVFYTLPIALGSLGLCVLMSILMAATGVLVSMRSKTAQEAAQLLMGIFLVPIMLVQVVAFVFVSQLSNVIQTIDGPQLLLIVLGVLAVADVVVCALAMSRFQRTRLSFD